MNLRIPKILILLLAFSLFSMFSQENFDIPLINAESMHGVNIIAFIADGVDIEELNSIKNYLETYGCTVTIAGTGSTVAGITVDILISNVNVTYYDCIFIPGGGSPANLVKNEQVLELIRTAYTEEILLAAICHGPLVFAEAGVINGTEVTGHQEIRDVLESAGGYFVYNKVVIDGRIITANWPYFEQISVAIASVLGYYETNVPMVTNCSYEIVNVNGIASYRLMAVIIDESGIQMITAYFYEASASRERLNSYFIAYGALEDEDKDGIFLGTFALEEGYYCVDIEVEDIFGNTITESNAVFLQKITETLDSTGTTITTSISVALPGLAIICIPLSILVLCRRKL